MLPSLRSFLTALPALAVIVAAPAAVPGALRELTTDRPDSTESPFTVDAGHVQIEMDFLTYGRTRLDGARTVEWEAAPFNLRWGVSANTELGVFVTPHR